MSRGSAASTLAQKPPPFNSEKTARIFLILTQRRRNRKGRRRYFNVFNEKKFRIPSKPNKFTLSSHFNRDFSTRSAPVCGPANSTDKRPIRRAEPSEPPPRRAPTPAFSTFASFSRPSSVETAGTKLATPHRFRVCRRAFFRVASTAKSVPLRRVGKNGALF